MIYSANDDFHVTIPNPLSPMEVKLRMEAGEYIRCHGGAECTICGKSVRQHPSPKYEPSITELCDGSLVKL